MTGTPVPPVPAKDDILKAAVILRKTVVCTPLLPSQALAEHSAAKSVRIKAEAMQVTGSFKVRGALWRCMQLTEDERRVGVVAYSSGNFAQGLAAAAKMLNIPATIVMPIDAPEIKKRRTAALGVTIVLSDHGSRPREEVASETARRLAGEKGYTLLHPFDDPLIITGHASAAVEVVDELNRTGEPLPDVVLSCVGGGGFVSGLAMGFHYLAPQTEVVAVEPEGFDSFGTSLAAGRITRIPGDRATICDALQATAPGTAPFACAAFTGMASHLTVSDDSVRRAMRLAFENLKLVLEPSGAAAVAALLEHGERFEGKRVVAFATGGNITVERFAELMRG